LLPFNPAGKSSIPAYLTNKEYKMTWLIILPHTFSFQGITRHIAPEFTVYIISRLFSSD